MSNNLGVVTPKLSVNFGIVTPKLLAFFGEWVPNLLAFFGEEVPILLAFFSQRVSNLSYECLTESGLGFMRRFYPKMCLLRWIYFLMFCRIVFSMMTQSHGMIDRVKKLFKNLPTQPPSPSEKLFEPGEFIDCDFTEGACVDSPFCKNIMLSMETTRRTRWSSRTRCTTMWPTWSFSTLG